MATACHRLMPWLTDRGFGDTDTHSQTLPSSTHSNKPTSLTAHKPSALGFSNHELKPTLAFNMGLAIIGHEQPIIACTMQKPSARHAASMGLAATLAAPRQTNKLHPST